MAFKRIRREQIETGKKELPRKLEFRHALVHVRDAVVAGVGSARRAAAAQLAYDAGVVALTFTAKQ